MGGQMSRWMDGWMDSDDDEFRFNVMSTHEGYLRQNGILTWSGGWIDGWTDGWMAGWMDRWMDDWMDGNTKLV